MQVIGNTFRWMVLAGLALVIATTPRSLSGQSGMAGMPGMKRPTPDSAQKKAKVDTTSPSMMMTPLDVPMDRMGSGTTWVPDAAPIASAFRRVGGWDFTGHGFAFAQYIDEGGPRGDTQFGSLNWGMLMASHSLAGGMIQLRTMLSLDALGVGGGGYPLLLQSGESFHGQPLHDRQHPHDFWMELSALYLRPISKSVGIEIYGAPSGEPALGPVAFMHRPSAMDNPVAPIGHHWQDATHISFGVATLGVFTHNWKIEGSVFNGREPDDNRWDFDFGKLDSYSGRVTFNPNSNWSLTAGYGRLIMADDSTHRFTASILHGVPLGRDGQWATTLIYGGNQHIGMPGWEHSLLLESEAVLDTRNTGFARMEFVQKEASDLVLVDSAAAFPSSRVFNVGEVSAGYVREVVQGRGVTLGIGVRGSVNFVPATLARFYGSRFPVGGSVFLRLRPVHQKGAMAGMPGMP
jgi:hypothetical protein